MAARAVQNSSTNATRALGSESAGPCALFRVRQDPAGRPVAPVLIRRVGLLRVRRRLELLVSLGERRRARGQILLRLLEGADRLFRVDGRVDRRAGLQLEKRREARDRLVLLAEVRAADAAVEGERARELLLRALVAGLAASASSASRVFSASAQEPALTSALTLPKSSGSDWAATEAAGQNTEQDGDRENDPLFMDTPGEEGAR